MHASVLQGRPLALDRRDAIPAVGTFGLVAALGFDEGGYAATAWGWSGVLLLAVLGIALARRAPRPTRPALVLVGGLAGLAGWSAVSVVWSSDVAASVLEAERLVVYAAAAALLTLSRSGPALLAGVLGAATALCGYGLARWLLGDPEVPLTADPQAADRLSEPIGYANGVGIIAAIGTLVALGFAADASRRAAAAAAASVPLLVATLYFTFGRGAWLALFLGLAVAIAADRARLRLAATAAALAPAAAVAVAAAWLLGARAVVAPIVVVLAAASAATVVGIRYAETRVRVGRAARAAFATALVAVPLAVVAAVLVRVGGPRGAYDAFTAAPAPVHGDVSGRVLRFSGSNRGEYWRVAWDAYRDDVLHGQGAGSYAREWLSEREIAQPVRDAHSVYLETLTEVGPLGLLLLLVALAAPFAGLRSPWAAAALGPYAAFLVHAAQDWDWELPAVTVAALACAAALVVPPTRARLPRWTAVVVALLAAGALFAYAGNRALAAAVAAGERGDYDAAQDAARIARRLQPWSGEPWRVLGEAQLARGSLDAARRSFVRGLDRDARNWELWLDLALASNGAARERALARVEALNPLSPELAEVRSRAER